MQNDRFKELSATIGSLNDRLRAVPEPPVDYSDPGWMDVLRNAPSRLDVAGVRDEAEAALASLLAAYASGDNALRETIRALVARNSVFAGATGVPVRPTTVSALRQHLLWISAIDQWPDPRDTLLVLTDLLKEARAAGVDPSPVLAEVAALSSDKAKSNMGSLRSILIGISGYKPGPR